MRQAALRSQSRIVSAVSPLYERIYAMVRRIPEGKVATYGQIAELVGRCGARQVGYAMSAVKDDTIPWQRVINAKGELIARLKRYGGLYTCQMDLKRPSGFAGLGR